MKLELQPIDYILFAVSILASVLVAWIFAAIYPPALAWWFWMTLPPFAFLSGIHLLMIIATRQYKTDINNQIAGAVAYGETQATVGALRNSKSEPEYRDEQEATAPKVAIDNSSKNRLVLKGK